MTHHPHHVLPKDEAYVFEDSVPITQGVSRNKNDAFVPSEVK